MADEIQNDFYCHECSIKFDKKDLHDLHNFFIHEEKNNIKSIKIGKSNF